MARHTSRSIPPFFHMYVQNDVLCIAVDDLKRQQQQQQQKRAYFVVLLLLFVSVALSFFQPSILAQWNA